jgi:hypothetical protein
MAVFCHRGRLHAPNSGAWSAGTAVVCAELRAVFTQPLRPTVDAVIWSQCLNANTKSGLSQAPQSVRSLLLLRADDLAEQQRPQDGRVGDKAAAVVAAVDPVACVVRA